MIKKLASLVILVLLLSLVGTAYGDLVARWRFDEGQGTMAYDSTGNGHDAEIHGGPAWVAGAYGLALDLDGSDDYAQTSNLDGLPVGTEPGSLTGWGRTDSVSAGWAWIVSYGNSGTNNARFLGRNGSTFYIGGYGNDISAAGIWNIGEWHHVAMTFDGTTAIAYADGVEVARADKAWNTQQVTLMMGQQISPAGEMWNGAIDDVRVYDHVLTVEELQLVMANQGIEASQPNPGDNEADVLRDTASIGWATGVDATAHDVYFGTDFDAVNDASRGNPMGVLVSQGQTGTTYPMDGILPYGQTYYWRIDEVQSDGTIVRGDVWNFTVEFEFYPIQNVTVTTNTTTNSPTQSVERLIDGSGLNSQDQHSSNTDHMWTGIPNETEPSYVQFEFDAAYKLQEMLVWNYNMQFEFILGYGIKNVTLEYSLDGADWTTLGDYELAQGTGLNTYTYNSTVPLEGVAARYIRMTINSNFANSTNAYGCSEIRFISVPVVAMDPDPSDGATNVPVDATLIWKHGREAVSHEVYLGTDPNALSLAGTTTESSFTPANLALETTHYWQIVEVNNAEATPSWPGAVWSFTVEDSILVDGFETYTDDVDAGETIWQTWIDGIDDSTNGGAVVGYGQSPFAEQDIVRSGAQAMPLFYDNANTSSFSETDRTFTPGQNWTANGIKTLTIWFHGDNSNAGNLYVKVNNTKVSYDGSPIDIATVMWQAWNIDLTTIGANLSNVMTLTIGVEGTGSGVVYIDDVRLYAKTPQTITPAEPGNANLVAYYPLNGNANDASGNGYNGTATGNYLYVTGVDGQALDVDGNSGYVDITNTTGWPAGSNPRTMAAWLLTRNAGSGARFAVSYGTGSTNQAMFLGMIDATYYGGAYGNDLTIPNFFVTDEWYHTALTFDGTTARLYANGLEVNSAEKPAWNLVLNRGHIGLQVNDLSEFWEGAIDEVYIYGRTLSAEEIAGLAGKTGSVHIPF